MLSKPRILLLDDDTPERGSLSLALRVRDFSVQTAQTVEAALQHSLSGGPDAIIIGMKYSIYENGMDQLQSIRADTDAPLLVLSRQSRARDIVATLESGADDYITMPVDPDVLAARIRAVIRRAICKRRSPGVLHAGRITLDLARHEVRVGGKPVELTPKEYDLLNYLMRNSGRMLSFRQILKAVWGDGQAYKRQYLRVYVMHLRRKLEPDPKAPRYIHSQLGVGYRFDAPLRAA